MSKKSKEQTAAASAQNDAVAGASAVAAHASGDDPQAGVGGQFVGQWNRLVSTTNWEKGRIICQWRDALVADAAPVTAYSDEAWSQLVGGVTSQHVGRLRRVFQRFGESFDQYEGLYWSHFQAALEWDDAEMWLEGAIHNGWSVSQLRGKRWETLGLPGEAPALDAAGEGNADDAPTDADAAEAAAFRESFDADADGAKSPARAKSSSTTTGEEAVDAGDDEPDSASPGKSAAKSRSRLAVDVDELPADLADAFEQFKLAIIAHRRDGWTETTPAAVIECLDALRELTLAPND